jgi:hypothetical protein
VIGAILLGAALGAWVLIREPEVFRRPRRLADPPQVAADRPGKRDG